MCFFCDPDVALEEKQEAWSKGGKREKPVLPDDAADPSFATVEDRQAFRESVAGSVGRGELDERVGKVLLQAVDGAAKEAAANRQQRATAPLVVEVADYTNGKEPNS